MHTNADLSYQSEGANNDQGNCEIGIGGSSVMVVVEDLWLELPRFTVCT